MTAKMQEKALITFFILTLLWLICIFQLTYYNSFSLAFLYIVIALIPDVLIIIISTTILKIEPEIFYTQYTSTILSTLSVNIILLILAYTFKKWLRKLINLKVDNNKSIVIYTILTLSSILIIFYTSFENIKIKQRKRKNNIIK